MPILNAPAHDFDTLWTVLQNCQAMTKKIGEKYTVITVDEQLYCKAKMLQWDKDSCKDIVIMLGGFHTQMNFSKVLGQFMDSSGLETILIESGVLGEGARKRMEPHHSHSQADNRSTLVSHVVMLHIVGRR